MSTHTPGPFTITGPSLPEPDTPEGGDYAILDADRKIVAECFQRVGWRTTDVRPAKANAQLFAAAPNLLAALLDVLPELESVGPLPKFERARAAIAAATGEAACR